MSKLSTLVCGLALAAAGPATAQEDRPAELRKVSQVIGSSVLLQDGVNYGKVEDIVLNEDGCIEYVVIAREDRYALMPWGVARVDYGQRAVIFDVTPQVVQPLFFARDAWPNVADPQFGRRVQDAFGPRAVRRESARPGPDAARSTEPARAKAPSRPGRGPDAPPSPPDRPRTKASGADAPPPPPDQPKAKARSGEPRPDAPTSPGQPKAKARSEERRPDAPPPPDQPKGKAREKAERP